MDRMKRSHFGVIFFGMGLTMTRGKHANSEALLGATSRNWETDYSKGIAITSILNSAVKDLCSGSPVCK